jgi:hypothetical protein
MPSLERRGPEFKKSPGIRFQFRREGRNAFRNQIFGHPLRGSHRDGRKNGGKMEKKSQGSDHAGKWHTPGHPQPVAGDANALPGDRRRARRWQRPGKQPLHIQYHMKFIKNSLLSQQT